MITIIADPRKYYDVADGAVLAGGPEDYVPARMALRRALDQGHPLTVHVTDQLLLHWFADLAGYAGVNWQQVGPEIDFRRLFATEPDPLLTPDLLTTIQLAQLTPPPTGAAVEPVAWILGERLDSIWRFSEGSQTHLTALVGWALRIAEEPPAHLHPLMQQRLARWADGEPAYASLRAGSLISDAAALVRRFALQRYEESWLRAQGLSELPLLASAPPVELCAQVLRPMAQAIERYWRQRIAGQPIDRNLLHAMIAQISGASEVELRFVAGLVTGTEVSLDRSLMADLRRRFGDLPGAQPSLAMLEARIPPAVPRPPDAEWSDAQWLRWATADYLPYFAWTVRFNQDRAHQQACARRYEEWLAMRYPTWLMSDSSPLLTRQFTLLRDLLSAQPNALVVWLVIDGMSWWQGALFETITQLEGLFIQRSEIGVALLPSLTDISKRGLVKGMAEPNSAHGSIAQTAREKLAEAGVSAAVSYDEEALLALLRAPEPPRCLLWFANRLDSLAHDRATFPDDELVRGYLAQLGRNLARMHMLASERGLAFHVLVGSDHGSTLLPPDAPTRRLPQATREVVDIWEEADDRHAARPASARAAVVAEGHALPREQLADWYLLDRQSFQLPQDYLVPRGYAAVGRKPVGWTHGGLTPEETLVPLLHLAPERLWVEPLQLNISGGVRSRQAGTLMLVLINPNPAPLDAAVIRIADLPPVVIERIPAMGRHEASISFPARSIDGNELPLPWELEGELLGVAYKQDGRALLPVRRLQTEDAFDDLFG